MKENVDKLYSPFGKFSERAKNVVRDGSNFEGSEFVISRPPLSVSTYVLQKKLGTQAVNFSPSTDRHEIFYTQFAWGPRAHDLYFEILIFHPKNKFGGGKPQNFENLAKRPSIGNS